MAYYCLARLLATVPLLLVVSFLVFLMVHLIPGSPAAALLGTEATPENMAALEELLGLDQPLPLQYARWLSGAVQGDLGESYQTGRAVATSIRQRLPVTVALTAGGMLVGVLLGMTVGTLAGLRPGTWIDRLAIFGTSIGVAIPSFWLAILFSIWLAFELRWFPIAGYVSFRESPWGWLYRMILPSLALGVASAAVIARQLRSAITNVLQTNYVLAARATGLPRGRIVRRYLLRNAMIPVVTVIGFRFAVTLGQAFVVEQIFGLPGLGALTVDSVLQQDIPMIQGVVMLTAVVIVTANLLVDFSYGWLNPKIRLV